jgi:hypothetical protein
MIIVVNVANYDPNVHSLIVQAHYAWPLGRLLDDESLREQLKFLVARKGEEILEIYCVKAVAQFPTANRRRSVKFLLEAVSNDCFRAISKIIQNIIINDRPFIINQGRFYITEGYLIQNSYPLLNDCDCGVEHIQVIPTDDKRFAEQAQKLTYKRIKN